MDLKIITVGSKADIKIYDSLQKKDIYLSTKIENVLPEKDEIWILLPLLDSKPYPLQVETEVDLFMLVKDRFVNVRVKVIERTLVEKFPIIKLKKIGTMRDYQRRESYRLVRSLPISYSKITAVSSEEMFSAYISDISGNGICLHAHNNINVGDKIECKFVLNNYEFKIKAIVVWKELQKDYKNFECKAGIKFENIEKTQKEKIIKYVFDGQRELLKKNLG